MSWEQSAKNLPEEIEAILPLPILRDSFPATLDRDMRMDEDAFQKMCFKTGGESPERRNEALERYKGVCANLNTLFRPGSSSTIRKKISSTRQVYGLCHSSLAIRRTRAQDALVRDMSQFEIDINREKEAGDRSFGLIQQLRIVQNAVQLKTVAGRFTSTHWLNWRAKMPTHVQRRSRLPSADAVIPHNRPLVIEQFRSVRAL
jgi:hypothetical protein